MMPEPCHFLDAVLGPVAIIGATSTKPNGAVAAIPGFVDDGLFIGQKDPALLTMVFQPAGRPTPLAASCNLALPFPALRQLMGPGLIGRPEGSPIRCNHCALVGHPMR